MRLKKKFEILKNEYHSKNQAYLFWLTVKSLNLTSDEMSLFWKSL